MSHGNWAHCPDCGSRFWYELDGFDQTYMRCYQQLGTSSEVTFKGAAILQDLHPCDEKLFWYYIYERFQVRERRERNEPKPWTVDKILQKYKFVNVFREHDRSTAWVIENFIKGRHELELIAFNICWYRMFSKWQTGAHLGWQDSWDVEKVFAKLCELPTPFTGAYIIHSEPGEAKLWSIVKVCADLFKLCTTPDSAFHDHMFKILTLDRVVEGAWLDLQQVRHVGQFMAYQMVLDMMYHPRLLGSAIDRDAWTCTGPGAMRGLRRLDPSARPKDSLERMIDLTRRAPENLPEGFPKLSIHDIEFSLCEIDKYCRVKYGEGRPRSTYPGLS